jgi:peroxiredoxin
MTTIPENLLRDRIAVFNAELGKQAPADAVRAIGRAIGALVESKVGARAPGTGDTAPGFTLPDATGKPVSLEHLLESGPVVLAFYRGDWCPYCDLQLRAYQENLAQITALGAKLVAVSPQTPDDSLSTAQKRALAFHVLSDAGNAVARRYGIVFAVSAELDAVQRGFGIDLAKSNGDTSNELPAPSVFVIGQDRKVAFSRVDPNWTVRVEPAAILGSLEALRAKR